MQGAHSPSVPGQGTAHYMVRVVATADLPEAACRGVVERLGSGEKRPFESSAELLRLLTTWSS